MLKEADLGGRTVNEFFSFLYFPVFLLLFEAFNFLISYTPHIPKYQTIKNRQILRP